LHQATLFVGLFLLLSSQIEVPRLWGQNHVQSWHPRSQSKIELLQENSLYPHISTIISLSIKAFPKNQNIIPVQTWAIIKRV
jgi:hypothetical protein